MSQNNPNVRGRILNPNRSDIKLYNPSIDNFSNLDFTLKDGSDPLNIDKFIHGNIQDYLKNHVTQLYSLRFEGKLAGFFTLSTSQIESKYLNSEDDITDVEFNIYPSLLLGQLGITKQFRGNDLGLDIIAFCLGLGQVLSKKVGCAFLILRTTRKLAERYYEPDLDFRWKKDNKEKVWMYKRLFALYD